MLTDFVAPRCSLPDCYQSAAATDPKGRPWCAKHMPPTDEATATELREMLVATGRVSEQHRQRVYELHRRLGKAQGRESCLRYALSVLMDGVKETLNGWDDPKAERLDSALIVAERRLSEADHVETIDERYERNPFVVTDLDRLGSWLVREFLTLEALPGESIVDTTMRLITQLQAETARLRKAVVGSCENCYREYVVVCHDGEAPICVDRDDCQAAQKRIGH